MIEKDITLPVDAFENPTLGDIKYLIEKSSNEATTPKRLDCVMKQGKICLMKWQFQIALTNLSRMSAFIFLYLKIVHTGTECLEECQRKERKVDALIVRVPQTVCSSSSSGPDIEYEEVPVHCFLTRPSYCVAFFSNRLFKLTEHRPSVVLEFER